MPISPFPGNTAIRPQSAWIPINIWGSSALSGIKNYETASEDERFLAIQTCTLNSRLIFNSLFKLSLGYHYIYQGNHVQNGTLNFPLKSTLSPASSSQIATPSFQSLRPKRLGFWPGFFRISFLIHQEILLTLCSTHPDFHHLTPLLWLPSWSRPSHDCCKEPLDKCPCFHHCILVCSPFSLIPAEQLCDYLKSRSGQVTLWLQTSQ